MKHLNSPLGDGGPMKFYKIVLPVSMVVVLDYPAGTKS